jgi:hypothetical protein
MIFSSVCVPVLGGLGLVVIFCLLIHYNRNKSTQMDEE